MRCCPHRVPSIDDGECATRRSENRSHGFWPAAMPESAKQLLPDLVARGWRCPRLHFAGSKQIGVARHPYNDPLFATDRADAQPILSSSLIVSAISFLGIQNIRG